MKLSVLIPAYNEEATLEEVIRRVSEINLDKEIIVVDDCSTGRRISSHPSMQRS
jgi:glycosyltransferase involved in cell wall biosynthesis